ncbi:MAG: glycosyltransferase [Rhodospirillales bacterium]|nr:glycosyltransferase [Rhodospirillales bacterium]
MINPELASMPTDTLKGLNLHLYPSNLQQASRMLRITGTLASHKIFSEIYLVGLQTGDLPERERIDSTRVVCRVIAPFLVKKRSVGRKVIGLLVWSFRVFSLYAGKDVVCVNPHSLTTLPLAILFKAVKKCKIVYDTHELETETSSSTPLRRVLSKLLERMCMPFVDLVIVVGDYIGDWYSRAYNLRDIMVIKNYPNIRSAQDLDSSPLRSELGISDQEFVVIYQGLLANGRGIELLLNAFSAIENKCIVFMGHGPLEDLVKHAANTRTNVLYHDPVAPNRVLEYVSGADVGVSLIENISLSYYLSCPNKIFEVLSAGLPVITSDFPEMKNIVKQSQAGWCIEPETNALVSLLGSISKSDTQSMSVNAKKWSISHNWEVQEEKLVKAYSAIL